MSCAIVDEKITSRKVQAKLDTVPVEEKISRNGDFIKFEINETAFYTINMVTGVVDVYGDISYPFSKSVLQAKMQTWISENVGYDPKRETLRCIDKSKYAEVYKQIKDNIGKHLVETWPECTDPEKYVYEDVAIATYLILLTDREQPGTPPKDITFLDAGCGNALFGWILAQQGYNYIGIDVSKRKIWDRWLNSVPKEVNFTLSEEPLTDLESFKEKFSDKNINWLIGNHSDELTPWISVLAQTLECNFLLIPCCSFDFNGKKFDKLQPKFKDYSTSKHRPISSNSTHFHYLAYVKSIALDLCGYDSFEEDILRIPSTKRHAFIGRNIKNSKKSFKFNLDYKIASPSEDTNAKMPAHDWREEIQNRVAHYLLRNVNSESADSSWSQGESSTLKDIIRDCELQDKLTEIKSIKGGLKAILLSHSQLFRIEKFGQISIRNWVEDHSKRRKVEHLKTKDCWFNQLHPQGCPLEENDCCFRH